MRESKKPEDRKNELVAVASELFVKLGYHETHIIDITEKARVSKGVFYYYFETKEAVLEEIIKNRMLKFLDELKSKVQMTECDVIKKFDMIVRSTVSFVGKDELSKVLMEEKYLYLKDKIVRHGRKIIYSLVLDLIHKGNNDETFKVSDPKLCAEILIGIISGFVEFTKEQDLATEVDKHTDEVNKAIALILGVSNY